MPEDIGIVIREYAPFVWRVLRHLGVSESQIEDASQEVLLVMFRRLDAFEARSTLRTWIYGICWNVAAQIRRERPAREQLVAEPPEGVLAAAQDSELALKQQYERLIAVLSLLDEEQRRVFVLYELEELTMEEIAAAIATPVTTCYSRLYAARDKVRAVFRREQRVAPRKRAGGAP